MPSRGTATISGATFRWLMAVRSRRARMIFGRIRTPPMAVRPATDNWNGPPRGISIGIRPRPRRIKPFGKIPHRKLLSFIPRKTCTFETIQKRLNKPMKSPIRNIFAAHRTVWGKGITAAALAVLCGGNALAQMAGPFSQGNLVVDQAGNGSILGGNATPIFLDQYSPGGVLISSQMIPTNGASAFTDVIGRNHLTADQHT